LTFLRMAEVDIFNLNLRFAGSHHSRTGQQRAVRAADAGCEEKLVRDGRP